MYKKNALVPVITICLFMGMGLSGLCGSKLDFEIVSANPRVHHDADVILIEFNKVVDDSSLAGNIELSNVDGSLEGHYTVELYPIDNRTQMVWLKLNDGFTLSESGKYTVTVKKGVRYSNKTADQDIKRYRKLRKPISHSFVTRSINPFKSETAASSVKTALERTKTVVISDIHIGDQRATTEGYNWFSENNAALQAFLDDVLKSAQIKELVIIGDLFDEWVMPADTKPFADGVTSSDEFFQSITTATDIQPIIAKLNLIADNENMQLVYVPGNHDMLFSEAALKAIFPKAVWKGRSDSTGKPLGAGIYSPESGISMEHGHIYDFYNSPDPYSQAGSILPPGYFVSRWFATKTISKKIEKREARTFLDNQLFYASWEGMLLAGNLWSDTAVITGLDAYTETYTQDQARDHYYNADIGVNWKDRQEHNQVYIYEPEWRALLVGTAHFSEGLLITAAENQYFKTNRANIVLFGHTHKELIRAYSSKNKEVSTSSANIAKIYANTGTWVNKSLVSSPYRTRTYVVIDTATSSTELDTVSVYQYNLNDGQGESTLLYEANIGVTE